MDHNIPQIDLHGMDREIARITVKDFIGDMITLKEDICLIIHGIGQGILQKEVHNCLKQDKRVLEYKLDFMNPGCTIVKLNLRG